MHKILIVDDEERDIKMLAMLLEHNFSEEYQMLFAASALEAFSEIKEFSPTLIFVDIKMPGMNGLELLNLIKTNRDIYPVVVSAYSDFEYTRGALLANAQDYLLKPVHTADIRTTLDKYFVWYYQQAQQKKKQESLSRQIDDLTYMLEKDIVSAVIYNQDYRSKVTDYLNMASIAYNWGTCLVVSIGQENTVNGYTTLAGLRSDIRSVIESYKMQSISAFLQDNIIFYLFSRTNDKQNFQQSISACTLQISGNILSSLDPVPHMAVAEPFASDEGMQYAYRVCMSKLMRSVIPAHLEPTRQSNTGQHVAQNIRAHKYHEANALLNRKLEELEGGSREALNERAGAILCEVDTLLFGRPEKSAEDYAALIQTSSAPRRTAFELLCTLEDSYNRMSESRQQRLVTEMRRFIDEKYDKQLSLTGLSQKFNLNSYYISKLFKEYTNQTFVEYLTQIRVSKAAQLIEQGGYSFKEISEMVGYNDPRYFSKVFKKITGKSPREYCETAARDAAVH